MIKINKFPEQTIEVFAPDGTSIGFANEHEFNDIKLQIIVQDVEGYYIVFNGEKISIDTDGQLEHWPPGLFDRQLKQYHDLIIARNAKNKSKNGSTN